MKSKRLSRNDEVTMMQAATKPEKLLFCDLQKCVLDFQLQEHEQFLTSFNTLFKLVDTSKHGILNEDQFMQLLELM